MNNSDWNEDLLGIQLVWQPEHVSMNCYQCNGRPDGYSVAYPELAYCRQCASQISSSKLEGHIKTFRKQLHDRQNKVKCPHCQNHFMADEHLAYKNR